MLKLVGDWWECPKHGMVLGACEQCGTGLQDVVLTGDEGKPNEKDDIDFGGMNGVCCK